MMLPQPPPLSPLPSPLKAPTESDIEVLPWAADSGMGYMDAVLAKRLLAESHPLWELLVVTGWEETSVLWS